jgi:hypothetical protein
MAINQEAFNYIKEKFTTKQHIDDYIKEIRLLVTAASDSGARNSSF